MTPALINNPLFRGITPEKLSANLEEISFHTRSYKPGEIQKILHITQREYADALTGIHAYENISLLF